LIRIEVSQKNIETFGNKTTNPKQIANADAYMGQFLQGGKNGRLMSYFF